MIDTTHSADEAVFVATDANLFRLLELPNAEVRQVASGGSVRN